MRLRWSIAAALAGVAWCATPSGRLPAQGVAGRASVADSATLRGVVVADGTDAPLAYAIVSIASLGVERFANAQGRFVFPRLAAGTYQLRARQLGHTPVTLEVTVPAGAVHDVTMRLPRITTRLAAMRVLADWDCETPGRPKGADAAATLEVFEQLEQNAERMRLLTESFPFTVDTERRFLLRLTDGTSMLERVDTTAIDGPRRMYRPGRVLYEATERGERRTLLQVPTLLDFADPVFQQNHCFVVRGVEETDGVPLLRVDFKAWRKLRTPDVDGSVFLDTADFRLRRSEIRLTRVPAGIRGLLGVHVTTHFVDLRPGLPVIARIRAVNETRPGLLAGRFTGAIEEQTSLLVRFLRERPDS